MCVGGNPGPAGPEGPVQVFSSSSAASMASWVFAPAPEGVLLVLEEAAAPSAPLHFPESSAPSCFCSAIHGRIFHTLLSCVVTVDKEGQREVGVRCGQMPVDQAVDGGLHLGGMILTHLGAPGGSAIRSEAQKMVWAGPGGRGWGRGLFQGWDWETLGGRSEAGGRASLGLFRPDTAGAEDPAEGPVRALLWFQF